MIVVVFGGDLVVVGCGVGVGGVCRGLIVIVGCGIGGR